MGKSDVILQMVTALAGTYITIGVFNEFLRKKEKLSKTVEAALWGFHFISGSLMYACIKDIVLIMLFMLAEWGIISAVLYEENWKRKAMVVGSYFIGTDIFGGILLRLMGGSVVERQKFPIFAWAAGKTIAVFVLQIVRGMKQNTVKGKTSRGHWFVCALLNGGTILLLVKIFKLTASNPESEIYMTFAFYVLVLLILNMTCAGLYDSLKETEGLIEQQNFACRQQMMLFDVQNEETEETWNELKKFRHDYANHLICIREYLKRSDTKEALQYVENLLSSFKGEYGTQKISNSFVDTFLGYKIRKANLEGVKLDTDIVIPKELPFEEADLCVILGNGLDNAMEAVHKVKEKDRYIKINISYRKHTLKVIIENSYDGEIKRDRKGKLLTTKSDSHSHGIGIYSMERAVKRYNGLLDISYTKDMFRLKILLYEREKC